MSQQLDNYINVLEIEEENSINVYYFDNQGQMIFLAPSHYTVDLNSREIVIKNDGNELAVNSGAEFYVSFIPKSNDREFDSYRFSYNPLMKITETLDTTYWDIIGLDGVDVIPNLDAYYFINEEDSTL